MWDWEGSRFYFFHMKLLFEFLCKNRKRNRCDWLLNIRFITCHLDIFKKGILWAIFLMWPNCIGFLLQLKYINTYVWYAMSIYFILLWYALGNKGCKQSMIRQVLQKVVKLKLMFKGRALNYFLNIFWNPFSHER